MSEQPPATLRGRARYATLALIFGVPLAAFLVWWFLLRSVDTTIPTTFDGRSEQLQRTVIVPTLDTPMPDGKNVIWCASFQLAWNKLKNDVIKEPVQLDENQEVATRLNNAAVSETDLPDGASYSAAGFDSDGIADKIRRDMERQFPGTPVTLPEQSPRGVTAYGYLRTNVKFTRPFFEHEKGFHFSDKGHIGGFGRSQEHESGRRELDEQVDVLYIKYEGRAYDTPVKACAVDLCKNSEPNQIVAARLPRGVSLADTLAAHQKLANSEPEPFEDRRFHGDELRVPNMRWKIKHDFKELLGRALLNEAYRGLDIDVAFQEIEFSLDRSGAKLSSQAAIHLKGEPREFYFDRPFLLYVKKRDSEHPFFVMWVDNDELLQRK